MDLFWENGALTAAVLQTGAACDQMTVKGEGIAYAAVVDSSGNAIPAEVLAENCVRFAARAGETYTFEFADVETDLLISPKAIAITMGETAALDVSLPAGLEGMTTAWDTEDAGIATVSTDGVVTAHQPGVTRITAAVGGRSNRCTVWVSADKSPLEQAIREADAWMKEGYLPEMRRRYAQQMAGVRSLLSAYTLTQNEIESGIAEAEAAIKTLRAGDTDMSGAVQMNDVVILLRYINGGTMDADPDACDVNRDSIVRIYDAVYLMQQLS